jgi:Flp pilus assembly protein TadG
MQAASGVPGISSHRRRISKGNALVEWMFVLLPTFALITAFFDVSFALFSWSTIQNAVREGCRYAITFQTNGGQGQDASIATIVAQNSMGLVTVAGGLIHVNYYGTNPATGVYSLSTAIPFANGGNVPTNVVEVSVQGYPLNWMVPLSGTIATPLRSTSPATINVYSADVLGGFPAGVASISR